MHFRSADLPRTSQLRGQTFFGDSWSQPFPINVLIPRRVLMGRGVRMFSDGAPCTHGDRGWGPHVLMGIEDRAHDVVDLPSG